MGGLGCNHVWEDADGYCQECGWQRPVVVSWRPPAEFFSATEAGLAAAEASLGGGLTEMDRLEALADIAAAPEPAWIQIQARSGAPAIRVVGGERYPVQHGQIIFGWLGDGHPVFRD